MNIEAKPQASIPILVADIYELAGRLRERGEAIAKTVGQTQAHWQVMSAASAEPHSVPQIARILGVTRQNVQRIADCWSPKGRRSTRTTPTIGVRRTSCSPSAAAPHSIS